MTNDTIRKLNNWFYRHGWNRENRGYEQYIWKEQETCFITHFDGERFDLINSTTVLIDPFSKSVNISNSSKWRSKDGIEKPYVPKHGDSRGFRFTAEELMKIDELYNALSTALQDARKESSKERGFK